MARRALASAAQLRELDGAWEKVSAELSDAVAFAVRQRPKDPLAAIVEHLSRHLPAGSTEALKAEIVGLHAKVQELTLENEQLIANDLTATLQAEIALLRAQVQELTLEKEQLKRESSVRAVPGEAAAASPALQALREKVQAVLAELEAAKPATAAAGTTASLPDGLKDFTPLAKEPEIKAIAEGLHGLDLAVARSHTSEAALAALRAEAEKLALATQAKIDARTAEARRLPTAEELEAAWAELMARLKARYVQEVVDPLQAAWEKASVDDKPRLLRDTMQRTAEGESFVPLIGECAAAILAGNRDFQRIYHAVYDVIRSGEADGMDAAQAAIAALGQAVRGDPKRLQQRNEAAEPATLLADAAGARPAFAEVVRCLSEATGARCVSSTHVRKLVSVTHHTRTAHCSLLTTHLVLGSRWRHSARSTSTAVSRPGSRQPSGSSRRRRCGRVRGAAAPSACATWCGRCWWPRTCARLARSLRRCARCKPRGWSRCGGSRTASRSHRAAAGAT